MRKPGDRDWENPRRARLSGVSGSTERSLGPESTKEPKACI